MKHLITLLTFVTTLNTAQAGVIFKDVSDGKTILSLSGTLKSLDASPDFSPWTMSYMDNNGKTKKLKFVIENSSFSAAELTVLLNEFLPSPSCNVHLMSYKSSYHSNTNGPEVTEMTLTPGGTVKVVCN